MTQQVKPFIKNTLEQLLSTEIPDLLSSASASSSSSKSSKKIKLFQHKSKCVQIVKCIKEANAFLVSDSLHTIPLYFTSSCMETKLIELFENRDFQKVSNLNGSLLELEEYHFVTSIQGTGLINLEILRKYSKELSFPFSIICNSFDLISSNLHIMNDPTDINKEYRTIQKKFNHYDLFLKLSYSQFPQKKGTLPELGKFLSSFLCCFVTYPVVVRL
jgi:hypothetical protein